MSKKAAIVIFLTVGMWVLWPKQTYAATLNSLSDTITTSRPSAAAPLAAGQAAGAGQVQIIDNNAVFLTGDSATSWGDPAGGGEITNPALNVASMSAANTPSAGERTVYLTNTITNTHHQGDAFVVPITAMHTISFKPVANIPSGGKIVISFPTTNTTDTNQASPSASTFMFNNLTTAQVQVNNVSCSGLTITAGSAGTTPSISCTTSGLVSGGTTVTFLIGCSAASGASCTTQVPLLINPMKKSTNSLSGQGATTTQADNWKIQVQTQDTGGAVLDSSSAVVGTIESVQVQASVDPTLTFQITGTNNGTTINNSYVAGCPNTSSDVTNAGINTNATFVNLGTVGTGITIAAQKMTVSTNGQGGYALTATSSGHLSNSNYNVTDNTTPAAMTAGTEFFGIHPCGTDVTNATTVWNNGGNGTQASIASGNGFVGWPNAISPLVLASRTTVANAIATAVEYAITASNITPAGVYTAVITYVATPTFN